MLTKEDCLFERDEEGNLIGRVVTLETLEGKPEVKVKPLTRGKLMSIFQKAKDGSEEDKSKTDIDVIVSGLVEPVLSEKDIEVLKPSYASAIVTAIISVSLGISQDKVTKSAQDILGAEAETKK